MIHIIGIHEQEFEPTDCNDAVSPYYPRRFHPATNGRSSISDCRRATAAGYRFERTPLDVVLENVGGWRLGAKPPAREPPARRSKCGMDRPDDANVSPQLYMTGWCPRSDGRRTIV
jgi:hypothetical protein